MGWRHRLGGLLDSTTVSRKILDRELCRVLPALPQAGRVLDVGGAGGRRYRRLVRADRYWTVDVSGTHRPTVVGDAHHLPIGSGSIDLVLSFQLLEHCNDPRRTVSEMHRVLAPGGTMVLSTVLLYALHGSPQDYYRFTDVALRDLAHQFDAVTVIPMGNRLTAAYDLVVARSLMLNTLFGRAAARLWGAPSDTCPSGYVMIARKASE